VWKTVVAPLALIAFARSGSEVRSAEWNVQAALSANWRWTMSSEATAEEGYRATSALTSVEPRKPSPA
jgi:hypothetical protein